MTTRASSSSSTMTWLFQCRSSFSDGLPELVADAGGDAADEDAGYCFAGPSARTPSWPPSPISPLKTRPR